jgi:hypothetical protein
MFQDSTLIVAPTSRVCAAAMLVFDGGELNAGMVYIGTVSVPIFMKICLLVQKFLGVRHVSIKTSFRIKDSIMRDGMIQPFFN